MEIQFLNKTVINSHELLQNAVLRVTNSNISQRKSKEQLIAEHGKLDFFSDKNAYIVHNICRQVENLQIENRISIANLQVDRVPTGRFLLCRTITRCMKINAILTLVEDPEGNVERLALYNWLQPATKKDQLNLVSIDRQFLPIATQLVIKNPYYKVASDGNTIICSDNPKDVIIIDHKNNLFSDLKWSTDEFSVLNILKEYMDKINKSADDYRRCGNDYFNSKDYTTAIYEYSNGINMEPQNVSLLANRAEVYLRLNQFRRAFADVEVALKHEPSHLKAAYRKGKALCGLKRYQEAVITLRDLHQRIKDNTDCNIASFKQSTEQSLKHAEMLDCESRNGKYDYACIIEDFRKRAKVRKDDKGNEFWVCDTGPRLDYADFLIDSIEIRPVKGKGRGWIAKCDIPENTLLMVSKAYRAVYNNEVPLSKADVDVPDPSECNAELMTRIGQSLIEEPDYFREVYQLYSGPNFGKLDVYSVNMDRIAHIVKYNAYTLQYDDDFEIFNSERLNKLAGVGLWILPSYFNHSCVDNNVVRFFIGDLMFIRSLRPISKGEELIVGYTSCSFSYERRSRYLKSVDINCQCRLCKLDRSETQKTKLRRAQLLDTYEKSIKPRLLYDVDPSLIKVLEETIAELRSLRKKHPELEFHSLDLRKSLASYYMSSNPNRSLSILKEAYDFLKTGSHKIPIGVGITFDISLAYIKLKQKKEANKWFDMALKDLVEPIRGKFKDNETKWRKEALYLAEKLSPRVILKFRECLKYM